MLRQGCDLLARRHVLEFDPVGENSEQRNRLVDRQVRGGGSARRDRRIEARVELEPHQYPPNCLEAVARHDSQMVAGAIGDAVGKRDLDVPCRALGRPLAVAPLQFPVHAHRHGDGAVGTHDRARRQPVDEADRNARAARFRLGSCRRQVERLGEPGKQLVVPGAIVAVEVAARVAFAAPVDALPAVFLELGVDEGRDRLISG